MPGDFSTPVIILFTTCLSAWNDLRRLKIASTKVAGSIYASVEFTLQIVSCFVQLCVQTSLVFPYSNLHHKTEVYVSIHILLHYVLVFIEVAQVYVNSVSLCLERLFEIFKLENYDLNIRVKKCLIVYQLLIAKKCLIFFSTLLR